MVRPIAELAERSVAAGIDHLTVGDHVSFADGHGADGLTQAAALLSAHPSVSVQTGVYLPLAPSRDRRAYALPFARFERYAPSAPPQAVAEALAPYLAVGCRRFNFFPEAASPPAAMEAAAEVKALLSAAPVPIAIATLTFRGTAV